MIYWLSGSLVILVLVTVLLTPESNKSIEPGTEASVASEKTIAADITSSSVQSTYSVSEESHTDGDDKTTDYDTKNVGALVEPESAGNDIYESQGKEANIGEAEVVRVLLIPDKETTVSRSGSSLAAADITKLNVALGSRFKTGNTLVTFNCIDPRARLAMAKAELSGTVETHTAKLRMQGLEQASDVEVALAASDVAKARATVKLSELQIRYCSIKAPWDGRVAKVYIRNHMTVTPGQPMLDLIKSGPLRLKVNVPSRLLSRLKVNSKFEVKIDETGKTYQASVAAINSRVDSVSQTVEIEGLMTQEFPELLAGMSGTAIIPK
jgi:membrane fusion protein (multidrug efflux system)